MIANKKQLADIFGVTDRTITDWEGAGLPIESRPGRGISNQYDTAKCIEWRTQRVVGSERQLSARERREDAQAKLYELQVLEKSSALITADDFEQGLEFMVAAAKGHLMSSPRRLKKQLDAKFEIDVPLELLMDHVRETLTVLAENAPSLDGVQSDSDGLLEWLHDGA